MTDWRGVAHVVVTVVIGIGVAVGVLWVCSELSGAPPEGTAYCTGDCDDVVSLSADYSTWPHETGVTVRFAEPVRGSVVLLSGDEVLGEDVLRGERVLETSVEGRHYNVTVDVDLRDRGWW